MKPEKSQKKTCVNIFYNIEVRKTWYENQEFIKEKTEKLKGKPYQTETHILGLSTED